MENKQLIEQMPTDHATKVSVIISIALIYFIIIFALDINIINQINSMSVFITFFILTPLLSVILSLSSISHKLSVKVRIRIYTLAKFFIQFGLFSALTAILFLFIPNIAIASFVSGSIVFFEYIYEFWNKKIVS